MTVTVHHVWPNIDGDHSNEQNLAINTKFREMLQSKKIAAKPFVDALRGDSPVFSFVDQASADEWVAFIAQFNPESVEVNEV